MTRQAKLFTYAVIAFLIGIFVTFSTMAGGGARFASAAASSYSNVLDDLRRDEVFNPDEYPAIDDDYSLNVIQIAESTAGELFIYVYQPAAQVRELPATSINISQSINDSLKYQVYKLSFLNCDGVFQKYLVEGLEVKADALRYYDISAIYREWHSDIDSHLPKYNENDIIECAWAVEKLYTVVTINGEVSYSCTEPEYVTVLNPYVGRMRYHTADLESFNGYFAHLITLSNTYVDTFYVAFSTDKKIDRLLSADVYYIEVNESTLGDFFGTAKQDRYVYLNASDKVVVRNEDYSTGHYKSQTKCSWDRIQSVEEFITSSDLTEEGKDDLKGQEWVLSFAEYSAEYMAGMKIKYSVSDVTVLRLGFETDGKTYSLGVISDRQNPNGAPDNPQETPKTWWDKVKEKFKSLWDKIADFFVGLWNSITKPDIPWWVWLIIILSALIVIFLLYKLIIWARPAPFKKASERRAQAAATSTTKRKKRQKQGAKKQ